MKTEEIGKCTTCNNPLPLTGYFCGNCLTQFKCKSCDTILDRDDIGCVICGTMRVNNSVTKSVLNSNTFRVHETPTERTIEATFSDNVGKDLSGILRDAYSRKFSNGTIPHKQISHDINIENPLNNEDIQEIEFINQDVDQKTSLHEIAKDENQSYPTLIAVSMKNLPKSETEWITVYSFYASDFGKKIYTRQNIIEKYKESNRKTIDKMNALSTSIVRAVQAGYINPLQNGFSILDDGIKKAKEIITRTSSSVSKSHKNTSSKNSKGETGSKSNSKSKDNLSILKDLDLRSKGKKSFKDFFNEKKPISANDFNVVAVYYLIDTLQVSGITANHIYTCYKEVTKRPPEAFVQSLRDTSSKKGYIDTSDPGNIKLTLRGRNFVEHDLPKEK